MPRHTGRSRDSFMPLPRAAAVIGAAALLGLTAAGGAGDGGTAVESAQGAGAAPEAATAEPNPLRNAYFGDLHTHTNFSYDAFLNGTRATPHDAYRYAKGEALTHPAGFEIQLDAPLDFYAVTDHASFLGMLPAIMDPEQDVSHPRGRARVRLRHRGPDGRRPRGGAAGHPGLHPRPERAAARPRRGALGLARDRRGGREPLRAGPLHHLRRLRVHRQPREPEPAPQRDLPGQHGARAAVQPPRLVQPRGAVGVDGPATARRAWRPWPSPTTRTAPTA